MRAYLLPFFLLPFLILPATDALARKPLTGYVLWVHDGDTVDVLTSDLSTVRVRLYGVDCPESDQLHGLAATLFSLWESWLRKVEVRVMDRDRYGRSVGWVFVGAERRNLNHMLVEQGHAWVYKQYCRARECAALLRAEDAARQARLGLWQDPSPMPPWEWRRLKRSEKWSR